MIEKFTIKSAQWLDDDTYLVNFQPIPTTEDFELEGVTEEVVVKYHKDENEWVVDKQYCDKDGGFIDNDTECLTEYEKAQYIAMASYKYREDNNNSWEEIVVADDYEKYDALVDRIRNYYAPNDDELSNEVEDLINARFMELLFELDNKYKK